MRRLPPCSVPRARWSYDGGHFYWLLLDGEQMGTASCDWHRTRPFRSWGSFCHVTRRIRSEVRSRRLAMAAVEADVLEYLRALGISGALDDCLRVAGERGAL